MAKKKAGLLVSVVLLFTVLGCTSCETTDIDSKLNEQGLDIISVMSEMAKSAEYISVLGGSSLKDEIDEIASGNYSTPKSIYKLQLTKEKMNAIMEANDADISALSQAARMTIEKRLAVSVMTQVNSIAGAKAVAASSVLSVGDNFICKGLDNTTLFIYQFEKGMPIAVTFIPEDEDIVTASGMFVINDGLQGADINSITDWFDANTMLTDCEIVQINDK